MMDIQPTDPRLLVAGVQLRKLGSLFRAVQHLVAVELAAGCDSRAVFFVAQAADVARATRGFLERRATRRASVTAARVDAARGGEERARVRGGAGTPGDCVSPVVLVVPHRRVRCPVHSLFYSLLPLPENEAFVCGKLQ